MALIATGAEQRWLRSVPVIGAIAAGRGALPEIFSDRRRLSAPTAGCVLTLSHQEPEMVVADAVLEAALYKASGRKKGTGAALSRTGRYVHRELKRKHVTLQVLWDEYIERQSGRIPLQSLLRSLPGLGGKSAGDDAPKPRRR